MSKRLTARLSDLLCKEIDSASEDGLRKIMEDCDSLSTTNCSWIEYDLRTIVRDMAQDQLRVVQARLTKRTPDARKSAPKSRSKTSKGSAKPARG